MAEKDPTPEETPEEGTTSEETAVETGTTETPAEEEVDYKTKFNELGERYRSQREEGIRLKKELEKAQTKPEQKPDAPVENKENNLDEIIDQKLQEKIAPLTAEKEKKIVNDFFKDNPDAMDHLEEIENSYLKAPGKTTSEKLENSFLISKKDAMREAGKKEMAFTLHQRNQAVAGGGGASSSTSGTPEVSLTAEEKEVAQKMGLKPEAYAQRKWRETRSERKR